MRLRFQERPWDLIAALAYTALVSAGILVTGIGTLWALLLVFFFPGYVLVAALFPSRGLGDLLRALADEHLDVVKVAPGGAEDDAAQRLRHNKGSGAGGSPSP